MLFSSIDFIFYFAPAALVFCILCRSIGYKFYLLAIATASIAFYGFHVPEYVLLLGGSAVGNYLIAGWITEGRRRWLFIAGIALNLLVLGYFKYANFFLENLAAATGAQLPHLNIVLPLAISFVTFEQIAFLSDVRSGRVPRGSPLEYFAFITLFPKLIAGPIIRYTEILPQLRKEQSWSKETIVTGICIFCIGLFKKVVIADTLAPLVARVYDLADHGLVSSSDAVWATLAYGARIYFDFSAYSDMAIGLAWMLGIRLPINFLSPYKATSIIEFWRRWHMTLSRFLRDYLYFSLGGNRRGEVRRYVNILLVMFLGGIWHGAGWTFVVWGTIHGVALAVNHAWRSFAPLPLVRITAWTPIAWLLTTVVVSFAWVFFEAKSMAAVGHVLRSLPFGIDSSMLGPKSFAAIGTAWAVALLCPNTAQVFGYVSDSDKMDWSAPPAIPLPTLPVTLISALAFVLSMIFMVSGTPNAFIYFQF